MAWRLLVAPLPPSWVLTPPVSDPLIEWLTRAGSLGFLALAVVGFLRGWVVSGTAYAQVREERDKALELVYRQAGLASRAVDLSISRLDLEAELRKMRQKEDETYGAR